MINYSKKEILNILKQVKDPEVPVLDIEELGVLRDVVIHGDNLEVTITPTYSGCPAMGAIEEEIEKVLKENNIQNYSIKTVLSPAWTTDWMDDNAKAKLEQYGIAPPSGTTLEHIQNLVSGKRTAIRCPFCKSDNTRLTSIFGSTACKALHYCNNCHQPFEEFKCH